MPTTTMIASEESFFSAAVYKEDHLYPLIIESEEQVYTPTSSYNQQIELNYIAKYQIDDSTNSSFSGNTDYELSFIYGGLTGEFAFINAFSYISFPSDYLFVGSFQLGISVDGGPHLLLDADSRYREFYPSYKPKHIPENTDVMTYEPVEIGSTEDVTIPTTSTWTVTDTPLELTNGSSISVRFFFSDSADATAMSLAVGDGDSTLIIDSTTYNNTSTAWNFNTYQDSILEGATLYEPSFGHMLDMIPSDETFYVHEIYQLLNIETTGIIDESELYTPGLAVPTASIITQFNIAYNLETEGGDVIVDENGNLVSVANPAIGSSLDTGQIFEPTILRGGLVVESIPIPSEEYFFPGVQVEAPQDFPLVAVLPDEQNRVTRNRIAPSLRYYTLPSTGTLDAPDLIQTSSNTLVPNYIRGEDALFRDVIYTNFYVRNASQSTNRTGINFWMNGGETFPLNNNDTSIDRFYENSIVLDNLAANGVIVKDEDYFRQNGQSNTSLFGQINISASILPKNTPIRDNISNLIFTPAYQKVALPDLSVGEYVGIHLRMEIAFNPDLGLPLDYSFFHLSYINGTLLETYPGQIYDYVNQSYYTQALPSVTVPFVTNYKKLLDLIDTTVDELYDRYPPFFLDYRDL